MMLKTIIFSVILIYSTINVSAQGEYKFSFFVAGHVYGTPLDPPHYGVHYPFADYISTLNNTHGVQLGFL